MNLLNGNSNVRIKSSSASGLALRVVSVTLMLVMLVGVLNVGPLSIGSLPTASAYDYASNGFHNQALLNSTSNYVAGTFTVYLSVKSNSIDGSAIIEHWLPVAMGAPNANKNYFVNDVLVAAMFQYPSLSFQDVYGTPIINTATYVYQVTDTNYPGLAFAPVDYNPPYTSNGWMFRINDYYVALNQGDYPGYWNSTAMGPCGADISTAFVVANDHVDFYFADIANDAVATGTLRNKGITYIATKPMSTLNVALCASYCYFGPGPNYYWYVTPFATTTSQIPTGTTFDVKVDGTLYTNCAINSSGMLTISLPPLTPSIVHTLEVMPIYNVYTIASTTYGVPLYSGYYTTFT